MDGGLTAEFPGEPERKIPEVKNEFEGATFIDKHIDEAQARLNQLESERATLTAHLDHTPGDAPEQIKNTDVERVRELDIKALQDQLERARERNQSRRKGRSR